MSATEIQSRGVNVKSYVTGFVLSVILTAIPFMVVMEGTLTRALSLSLIAICGVLQALVHLRFFLHVGCSPDQRENSVALAFTIVLIAIMIAGTVWIMADLHHRM